MKNFKKFGLFSSKDLHELVNTVLDEREEELIKYRMKTRIKKLEEDSNYEKNGSSSIDPSINRDNIKKLTTSFNKKMYLIFKIIFLN